MWFLWHFSWLFTGVVVQILGIGKCAWTEQRRAFGAEEIYIKDEIKIYESSGSCATWHSNQNNVISRWNYLFDLCFLLFFIEMFHEVGDYMSPGIYIYPFETELPSNLPTSCEGKYGFIRYLASANVIRPNATTQTQTIAFTVIKPHNLNALSIVQVGLSKSWIFQVPHFCHFRWPSDWHTAQFSSTSFNFHFRLLFSIWQIDNNNNKCVDGKIELHTRAVPNAEAANH